ncbi:putative E3 ubiquitin-protein ligase UBR7 [Caerostris extrusa]|uniref:E3 ubiquitin-protein ligase UBR7 n=1 Tax=Caerostris extrusa TaxID=172846 RepID=A0AAV4XYR6_CAEEX|nr:putative E3 ubiquitin-protein ligase UBR7 [Caerostris extrusa]
MADTSKNSNEDTELTMCDVLEEEQELEEDANAVLGGSDDTNCSYDQGYVSRQALYACKSCSVEGDAGVCLACCYACHDGHEVVELYTKRDFRCDCGNSKFNGKVCVLRPSKDAVNSKNKYNQNFKGLYCSCSRPYPDLEDSFPDEMIQCIMCEDWFHGRHLKVEIPEDYHEMICYKCMEAHKFLFSYLDKNVTKEAPDSKILSSEQSEMKTGNNIKSELASNGCASKEEKELIDVVNDDVNSCVVKNEQNKSNEDNKPAIKSDCREFIETTKSNSPKVELNENNSASSSKVKTETMCNGS